MTISKEEFRSIRKQLDLTQKELAEKMGYSAKTRISEKENGKRSITTRDEQTLKLLLDAES
ncbi:MAG: helix-turn-helix transcriptional regulator [Chloroflexota bacterium]|jgi:transcriptional regulator with XRE-family HTH domain|nr:helix-turn-helix transcriptional regulator [Chloroflexota bacterium]